MAAMGSPKFRSVVAPMAGLPAPAPRRPLLTLKPKAPGIKRFDDGGMVEKDIDVSPVDALSAGAISNEGGFFGGMNPEMGGGRNAPGSPNVSSGLVDAQDQMADPTLGDRLADLALGSRSLSFDPVTGTFSASRDILGSAARSAVSTMFGPLGPVVSLGMRAGSKYGEGQPEDYDASRGYGNARGGERGGAGMWRGGRVHLEAGGAPGGVPPQVAALIAQAMAARGGAQGPAPGQPAMPGGAMPPGTPAGGAAPSPGDSAPPGPPTPFQFIPPVSELVRRYGAAEAPQPMMAGTSALAHGGQPGASRSGLFRGPGTGRSDDIPAELDPDGFVLRADYMRRIGDGSPEKGAARIADTIGNPDAAKVVPTVRGGAVPAKVSTGEMYLDPHDTARAGGPSALAAAQGPSPGRRKGGRGRK